MTHHRRFITRFVLSRRLANLRCLCRNTLRETTRRCCSACVGQRNKWSRSSVSEGPHIPPLEGCTGKVGFWKIILAPSSVAKARPPFSAQHVWMQHEHMKNLCSSFRWFYRHSNKVALFKFCFSLFCAPHLFSSYLVFARSTIRGRYSNTKRNCRQLSRVTGPCNIWCLLLRCKILKYNQIFDRK